MRKSAGARREVRGARGRTAARGDVRCGRRSTVAFGDVRGTRGGTGYKGNRVQGEQGKHGAQGEIRSTRGRIGLEGRELLKPIVWLRYHRSRRLSSSLLQYVLGTLSCDMTLQAKYNDITRE